MDILRKFYDDAINIPHRDIYDFLDCSTDEFDHNVLNMHTVWEKARDIAGELKSKGAKKGDRAIILCMQDEGTVYSIWGCMMAGVIFTVIPPPIDPGKVQRFVSVLKSCSPKYLISNESLEKSQGNNAKKDILKGAFKELISVKRIYTDKVKPHPEFTEFNYYNPEDTVYLQYTSGSTSEPKGVMVGYGNISACLEQCLEFFDFTKGDHNLCSWVPFYHNLGLVVAIILPIVVSHGISYFIPTLQFLAKPTIWIKALSDYKINATAAPNSAYEIITQLISEEAAKKYDLSHMTHMINGSEFVDTNTVEKFCKLFNISPNAFAPGYGLSECVCVASLASNNYKVVHLDSEEYRKGRFIPSADGDKAIVSVGSIAGDMVVKVVDKNGLECKENEIGELYLKSSTICGGYYKNPQETKRFHSHIEGVEGDFYATGDMGYIYEDNIYLTGRIKEMIIISGKNFFPGDIIGTIAEEKIGLYSDSMSVFSIKQEGMEAPVLFAEISPDLSHEDAKVLMSKANQIVSKSFGFSFMDIVLVPKGALPRTDNRKIKTLETKRRYMEGEINSLSSLNNGVIASGESRLEKISFPSLPKNSSLEDIKEALYDIFTKLIPDTRISDSDSILDLGVDSLTITTLVSALEDGLNISFDLRRLIEDPSINGISDYIYSKLNNLESDFNKDFNLYDECVLPQDFKLTGEYECLPGECKNIFLTGSTGFLGAYTIDALLKEHGQKDIKIYAHARATTKEACKERIISNLKRFDCYKPEYMNYIVPVCGDLVKPMLGMDKEEYDELSKKIDMVIHNGAILNFLLSYSKLKDANVTGTMHALRFAMTEKPKYFNYISSYSVYDNPSHFNKTVSEDDPLNSKDGYFLGYSETKWVSEKLVQEAQRRGLRAIVYRPGDITGTVESGIWKLEDLISRSIVGCIQLGAVPNMDVHLHLTAVDYVAAAISHISFCNDAVGHGVNIINNYISPMSNIMLLMKKYGYNAKLLPYEDWCNLLVSTPPEKNVLRVLSCLFTDKKAPGENLNERYSSNQAIFSTENCDRFMADSKVSCPPMNEKMLVSYLNNFYRGGYIKKPAKWYQRLFNS